jgi:mRNA interferase RelE/StbE
LPYRIEVAKQARNYIEKLDKPSKERFRIRLDEISQDPWGESKQLVNINPPARSCRVGNWRIVFSIDDENRVIIIAKVMPRGQVYDRC